MATALTKTGSSFPTRKSFRTTFIFCGFFKIVIETHYKTDFTCGYGIYNCKCIDKSDEFSCTITSFLFLSRINHALNGELFCFQCPLWRHCPPNGLC